MQVLIRSNNSVRLSFLASLLRDAGLTPVLLDAHASIMDGSIGAVPRRLAVADEEASRARHVLRTAGEM